MLDSDVSIALALAGESRAVIIALNWSDEAVAEFQNSKGHNCPENRPSGKQPRGPRVLFLPVWNVLVIQGRESWSPGKACPSPGSYSTSAPSDAARLTLCTFSMMITLALMAWELLTNHQCGRSQFCC